VEFGISIILFEISSLRVFAKNTKDSLFYNVPENFASIDGSFQPMRSEKNCDKNFHVGRSEI
jgi:hypothetical protein